MAPPNTYFYEENQELYRVSTRSKTIQKPKYSCSSCNKNFSSPATLANHKKAIHLKIKDFKCRICSKEFSSKNSFQIHLKSLHPEVGSFSCYICGISHKTKVLVKRHLEDVHRCPKEDVDMKKIIAEGEKSDVIIPQNLVKTRRRSMKERIILEQLDDKSSIHPDLQSILPDFDSRMFHCQKCTFATSSDGEMIKHFESEHILLQIDPEA